MKRIIKIDSTVIRDSSCFLRFVLRCVHGYREEPLNNSIVYGQAVHTFVETYEKTGNEDLSIAKANRFFRETPKQIEAKRDWLDAGHLTNTLIAFAGLLKKHDDLETLKDSEGNPLVEKNFAIPLYEDDDVGVLLCGTTDRIVKKQRGVYAVGDYKTTSYWNVEDYFSDYKASSQLKTYIWAIKWHAQKYPDSIFGTIWRGTVGAVIDGVFLSKTEPTEFKRSEFFFFSDEQMQEFEFHLMALVEKLVRYVKTTNCETYPTREGTFNGACKTPFGKCMFFHACCSECAEIFQGMLNNCFTKVPYDPLNFKGTKK